MRIGIRATDPSVLALLPPLLPPTWKSRPLRIVDELCSLVVGGQDPKHPHLRRLHLAYSEGMQISRSDRQAQVLEDVESFLGLSVAALCPRRIFVHAGVVGWKGGALLLPGKSRAGKSTLVAALLRAGATYYSDEYAVLDDKGWVHPYPRAISLRTRPGEPNLKRRPEELGAKTGTAPLPVTRVVMSEFHEGATWRPRTVSGGRAVLELLAHTVPARRRPEAAFAALTRVAKAARTVKGTRGEADAVAAELLEV